MRKKNQKAEDVEDNTLKTRGLHGIKGVERSKKL